MSKPPNCLRLVYASRATFTAGADNATVNADVARILMQSRRNNPANGLVGALYFADGCFLQCLEGSAEAVESLYARLQHDPRHRDLKVLARSIVERPSFTRWSMKFVPNAAEVRALLDRHGLRSFDPYQLGPAALSDFVTLLVEGADAALPAPAPATPADPTLALARQARLLAIAALAVSAASLGVALL